MSEDLGLGFSEFPLVDRSLSSIAGSNFDN